MPKLPLGGLPPLPDPAAPFRVIRKLIKGARKGVKDSAEAVKDIGKEMRGEGDTEEEDQPSDK